MFVHWQYNRHEPEVVISYNHARTQSTYRYQDRVKCYVKVSHMIIRQHVSQQLMFNNSLRIKLRVIVENRK